MIILLLPIIFHCEAISLLYALLTRFLTSMGLRVVKKEAIIRFNEDVRFYSATSVMYGGANAIV